ncbi:MAG: vancomycin resistance protein, partial [Lachnospiraceae bacterium]|nr:vancomycin resistance protein [Lachnospiraceae bacterium]
MSNKKGMRKDKAKVLLAFLALFLFLGIFTLEADSAGTDDRYQTIFDAAYYAAQYPDVTAVYGTDARELYHHFVYQGIKEGRSPSAEFVLDYYKANYPDLSELGHVNIYYYRHYVQQGKAEGREASKLLSNVAESTAQTPVPNPSGNIV